jgi:hypothetical protein
MVNWMPIPCNRRENLLQALARSGQPPVDRHDLAGDVASAVGAEEADDGGDLLGLAGTPERGRPEQLGADGRG